MSTIVHGFDWPDRFVVGTIGEPGDRAFYLQARDGDNVVSVALEKEQTAALAERLDEVLDELMRTEDNRFSIPATAPSGLDDNEPLDLPVLEQFRVGVLTLGWDPSTAQIVIEAHSFEEGADSVIDPADPEPEEALVVRIPVGSARAFTKRTRMVVASGRQVCALCRRPMDDPSAHVCDPTDQFE